MREKERRVKVYLAGPDVFFPNARQIGSEKKRICQEFGFEGFFPLDNELPTVDLGKDRAAEAIFRANCEAMDAAHLLIANMMPFRGVSIDAGTAFELGYMYAQGKPVFGYGGDDLTYLERILRADLGARSDAPYDRRGMRIEDFDLTDNLMLVCAVRRYGLDIAYRKGELSDLSAFRECVRFAAERLPLLRVGR